jgi:hypothetical protein
MTELLFLAKIAVIYVVLAIALYGLARFVHSLVYTEIPRGLTWRAFAAAGVIWGVALGWPLLLRELGANWPISFNDLFLGASAREEMKFKEFTVPAEGGRTVTYTRKKTPRGVFEYLDSEEKQLPTSAPVITGVREDNGERITFKREVEKKSRLGGESVSVRYVNEEQGLIMPLDQLGTISSRIFGRFVLNILGGTITLTAWFLSFWLLLLFQWPHGLGLAIPAMLVWVFVMNFVM